MNITSKPESAEVAEGTSALTEQIIGAAIEVHRHTGPGLMESAYEECLCYELSKLGLSFKRQVHLPVSYKGIKLDCGYKMDLVVEDAVILEIKTVDQLLPVHTAQLLTYLKLSGKKVGLLLNFNSPILKKGIKRLVNHFPDAAPTLVPSAASATSGVDFKNSQTSASPRLGGETASGHVREPASSLVPSAASATSGFDVKNSKNSASPRLCGEKQGPAQ